MYKYVAQPGESLYSISRKYNIPVSRLSKDNPQIKDVFFRFRRRRPIIVPIIIPPIFFPFPPFPFPPHPYPPFPFPPFPNHDSCC